LDIQTITDVDAENELQRLLEVLNPDEPTIIFCERKTRIEKVSEFLRSKDIKNLPFSNDQKMTSQMRTATLNLF